MLGLEFADGDLGYAVSKNLFARQILIGGTYINARTLRVEPPLTISYPQMDRFVAALDESLAAVYEEHHL